MSRQILTLDSSQIEKFLNCDMEWNYSYNENLVLNNEVREDMAMGSYGHKLLETYYHAKATGNSPAESAKFALEVPLDDFPISPKNRDKVREAFNRYTMIYGANDVTVLMGRGILKSNFNENGEYINDIYELNPLVEKGFSFPLLDNPDYLFILEGRIDLLCDQNGIQAFMDHKFQSRENRLYKKSIQFRNYGMVTGVSLGIINYIRYHADLTPKTLVREFISFTSFEHEWWKKQLIKTFTRISHAMKTGEFEQRWNMCKGQYGYPCNFTPLCNERNDAVRENIKIQTYRKREAWKPW